MNSEVRFSTSSAGKEDKLPLITWGGDEATILANGNAINTKPGSIFAQKGLKFKLAWMDDFKKQVEMFIRGDMWLLRGTMGMINMASAVSAKACKLNHAKYASNQLAWIVVRIIPLPSFSAFLTSSRPVISAFLMRLSKLFL